MLNWLNRERLQFTQTLNDEEQEKCKSSIGLLEVMSEKQMPQYKTILSLQCCRLIREQKKILKNGW